MMNRRQFAFWVSAGLFSLSERLGAETLDTLAAVVMQCSEKKVDGQPVVDEERWSYHEDRTWRWFERETKIDERWELTGRTRPVHRMSGELAPEVEGYLPESLVPDELRFGPGRDGSDELLDDADEDDYGEASAVRRARDGRPPSRWLRSLYAEELRLWLPEVEVPPAGVSGMTVWTHLTRDHRFIAERIRGLNDQELAKLHAVAHYGY
ncbi:hypothetical protein [Aeoliella mucimassa]|uniref:Uncharacterized protein n=1 Tax=Aeoliella mucimassa TaxID=2527972 RepID=A0A518AJ44_9BACT|nr:hypothetical protein [Aeoliella mucimassa]QDU54758.1 hypothetical protein Pan181_09410 [Aeoliella mucimassa]